MAMGPETCTPVQVHESAVPPVPAKVAASELGELAWEQTSPPLLLPQVEPLLFKEPEEVCQVPLGAVRVPEEGKVSLLPILKSTALMSGYSVEPVVLIVSTTVQVPLVQFAVRLNVEPNPSLTPVRETESA